MVVLKKPVKLPHVYISHYVEITRQIFKKCINKLARPFWQRRGFEFIQGSLTCTPSPLELTQAPESWEQDLIWAHKWKGGDRWSLPCRSWLQIK